MSYSAHDLRVQRGQPNRRWDNPPANTKSSYAVRRHHRELNRNLRGSGMYSSVHTAHTHTSADTLKLCCRNKRRSQGVWSLGDCVLSDICERMPDKGRGKEGSEWQKRVATITLEASVICIRRIGSRFLFHLIIIIISLCVSTIDAYSIRDILISLSLL